MYQHIKVPASRAEDQGQRRLLVDGARRADHSLHRRRRHRRRHHAGDDQGGRCGGRQGLWRQEEDPLDGDLRRREVDAGLRSRRLAAARDARGAARVRGLDQGTADDAGRRRHPLAQRRTAPGARPLRLPAPGPVLQGRAVAGQGAGEDRHGDLPRELRGHLRRHRVRGREREGQEPDRVPAGRFRRQEDPLPGHLRHRHQAGVARRHRAAGPQGDPVRDRQRQAFGDAGPQGQHHEVHRGRLPRLGLRAGAAGVRRAVEVDGGPWCKFKNPKTRQGDHRQGRRSPTRSCSRSCCARPSTR